ncbi:DUF5330 domain-containing protein [Methyloceanibacter sp.]|uniref:DUF5330 domain-containing protein n=1 Tax=Methyloceanibacter sp. TaxID=1965321 RepID=UPI002D1FAC5E|nr:DUF5330 domain-containing protein [Methyloceanibacter sp.]
MSGNKNGAAANREGKQMMFLIRSAFWLVVLILLIPTDEAQQKQIYGTAQSAVADIRGFCDRNPKTCASSQYAFNVLVQKAQYGAQMITTLVEEQAGNFTADRPVANAMPSAGAAMPVPSAVPLEPTPWVQNGSQNTLNPEDLEADWSGPNV